MAGRNYVGVDVSRRRCDLLMRISYRLGQHHSDFALLAGHGALRKFQGRFRFHFIFGLAGIRIVHAAAANVWLPVSDSYAAGDGEISPGSFLAVVDAAPDFSGLGEYARIIHHWNRRSWFVFSRRIIFVSTGQRA